MTTTPWLRRVSAALLALAALMPARGNAQAIEHPKLTLSIGTFIISYLPLPVADAKGLFKAQGLDVTIQNFGASGAKALQSLIGGSSDVVVGFYDHTVQMQAEGQDVRCVILLNKNPGIALAVRDDLAATIKDAKDLKGKNIGVTGPGSSTDFLLRYLLVRAGVKPEDVSIIGVGSGASVVAAMERKSIDAVMNYDPAITMLERRKLAHVMVDGRTSEGSRQAFGGPYPASCLYSTGAFIAKNPVTIQRLVNAFAQALTFIDKTPAPEIAAALPPEYGLGDPGLFAEVIGHSKPMFPAVGTFDPKDLARAKEVLSEFNEKVRGAKIRLEDTYTNRFVESTTH
jgi:NitT/TauT family transport system substrate-binding protein